MKKKVCFKCRKEKELSDFYKHSQMADGYLNKCKDCTRKDTRSNRSKNIEHYREYDRTRGNRQSKKYHDEYRERYPQKYKAKNMVNNFVRDGKLFKEPCEVCGNEEVHAHHDDYLKPLNVRWLCAAHHRQWHIDNGEGKNGDYNNGLNTKETASLA